VLTATGIRTQFDAPDTPLHQVTFVVLDLETTGATPLECEITEIGAVKLRGGECLGTFETLVNPGVPVPAFVAGLTGITDSLLRPAPTIDEVLPPLLEFLGTAVIVGHNLQFDTGFLDTALVRRGRAPLDHPRVDTLALARRLVRDEIPDHRLGTLAHHLQSAVVPCHRALADASATADVLHALLERAGTLGVFALDDLHALPGMRVHPTSDKLRLTGRLPRRPGVYQLRGRAGQLLFVAGAANLRAEVRGLFHGDPRRKVPQLLRETTAIDWFECADESEAHARAGELVAAHAPRFNDVPARRKRRSRARRRALSS
jgi:DNA polymerase III subunit epsilon